jgi:hypothetical protein
MSARLATKAEKAPRENSAIQKSTEFFFDESGNRPVALLLPGEESFQLFRYDLILSGPVWYRAPEIKDTGLAGRLRKNQKRGEALRYDFQPW